MTAARLLPGRYIFVVFATLGVANAAPAHAKTIKVVMEDLSFTPQAFKAKVGDTVVWINKDIFPHAATAEGVFDVFIDGKASEKLVLDKPGKFEIYCRFHPNMRGEIMIAPRPGKGK